MLKIIDIHTHIFGQEDYAAYFSKAPEVSKALVLIDYQKIAGMDALIDLAEKKGNLFIVGAVDMNGHIEEQLKRLEGLFRAKKIVGIKLYPGYQYFYPFEERVFPIAELCQKYGKPLVFHSGATLSTEGNALLKYSHPIHVDDLAVRFPKCKIVISHFGFPWLSETATIIYKNGNVYTDISGTIESFDKAEVEVLLDQYAKDLARVFFYYPETRERVMFGTDFSGQDSSLCEVRPYIELVKRVFPKTLRENVFRKLAENLFFN
jgi:uncharacterized protein